MSTRTCKKNTTQDAPVTPPTHTVKGQLNEVQANLVMRLAAQRQAIVEQAQKALGQINGELGEIAALVAAGMGLDRDVKYDLYVAPEGGVYLVEQVGEGDNASDGQVQSA